LFLFLFCFYFLLIYLDSLANGRFHQQLRDTFAPLVIRYVDLMESCIAQSIHKGFEKENWKSRTYGIYFQKWNLIISRLFWFSRGCATSEDMLWKLDALQCFIRDLHWVCEENEEVYLFVIVVIAGSNVWWTFRKKTETNGIGYDWSLWEKVEEMYFTLIWITRYDRRRDKCLQTYL